MIRFFCLLIFCCLASGSYASEADSLWLRMPAPKTAAEVITRKMTPTIQVAVAELKHGWRGVPVVLKVDKSKVERELGSDGYWIRTATDGKSITISSIGDAGLLYGAFQLLRMQQTGASMNRLDIKESPSYKIRILNHWDNLDRTIERGYAGRSLWN